MSVQRNTVKTLVSALHGMSFVDEPVSHVVKVGKRGLTIKTGQICEVKCRLRALPECGTLLFEPAVESSLPDGLELFLCLVDVPTGAAKTVRIPIQNSAQHKIFLPPKTVLGSIEDIIGLKAVCIPPVPQTLTSPLGDTHICSTQVSAATDHKDGGTETHRVPDSQGKWHPPVALDHLTYSQQEVVHQMVFEESDVFSRDEGDNGCIPDLKLKINTVDDNPEIL